MLARGKNIAGASDELRRRRCKRGIRSAAIEGGNLTHRKARVAREGRHESVFSSCDGTSPSTLV
jgi:hypothetical protein